MKTNIERAKEILKNEGNTCVLVRDEREIVSQLKGIAPMLGFIASGEELAGFSAADRIVGRAAALLFVYCGISEVYAEVLSSSGEEILKKYAIPYTYQNKVEYIINRMGTGLCPMEETVKDITDPVTAHFALTEKVKELRARK